MKDGAEGDEIVSRLAVVEIGVDEDGQPLTSCVVEPADVTGPAKAKAQPKLSDKNQIALDALRRAIAAHGASTASQLYPAQSDGRFNRSVAPLLLGLHQHLRQLPRRY
jgi:hypothetical protein